MVRTVKVRLELDRDDYKRGLRDAANETRGFDGEVRAAGKDAAVMGVEVKAAGTQVESMGREVDAAAKKTTALGDEVDKAKGKTTGLGEESRKTSEKVKDLDARLRDAKATVRELSEEFLKGGRSAESFAKLSKAGKDVQELEKLKKAVEDFALEAERVGVKAGGAAASGMASAFQSLPPQAQAAIVAGIVGAIVVGAPVIGAAAASAVTLGVGGGALAAGIALASRDARVQDAWSKLGTDVKAQLVTAGAVFAPGLVRAADTFGAAMSGKIMPSIRSDFASLAPLVDRLAAGASGFAERMMPGLDRLIAAAGPFLNVLAEHLPAIGEAIGRFFSSVAAGAPGATQFFGDFLHWAEVGIVLLGYLINGLSTVYGVLSGVNSIMSGDASGSFVLWETFAHRGAQSSHVFASAASDMMRQVKLNLQEMDSQIGQTAITTDTLAGKMAGRLLSSMMSVDQAALGFAQSQLQVADSIKQNGRELDIHTAKGEANRGSILAAVQANMAQYQANIAVGMAAGDAALAYDANTTALENQLHAAHFTQAEIDGLIGKYRGVPAKVNTEIAMKGLTEAINSLDDAIRLANGLDGRKVDTYVTTHFLTDGIQRMGPTTALNRRYGGIDSYAQGGVQSFARAGIYAASGPGLVKFAERETGGEAYIPRLGISQDRAMGLASKVGDWHGFDVVPRQAPNYAAFANSRPMAGGGATVVNNFNVTVNGGIGVDGYQLGQQFVEQALRPFVQRNGNNVQMAVVGRQVS